MVLDQDKLAKLQAASRIGGKGTPRRKAVRKPKGAAVGGDDKKLQTALKKLNVQPVTGVEEVNMFREDGNVLHFNRASVHGIGAANTHAVYGAGVDKELTELMPNILSQIGPDSLASLKKLAESYQAMGGGMGGMGGMPGMGGAAEGAVDDEVPDTVGNFDAGDDDDGAPVDTNVDTLD